MGDVPGADEGGHERDSEDVLQLFPGACQDAFTKPTVAQISTREGAEYEKDTGESNHGIQGLIAYRDLATQERRIWICSGMKEKGRRRKKHSERDDEKRKEKKKQRYTIQCKSLKVAQYISIYN